jgi:hypothetical protein
MGTQQTGGLGGCTHRDIRTSHTGEWALNLSLRTVPFARLGNVSTVCVRTVPNVREGTVSTGQEGTVPTRRLNTVRTTSLGTLTSRLVLNVPNSYIGRVTIAWIIQASSGPEETVPNASTKSESTGQVHNTSGLQSLAPDETVPMH